MTSTESFDDLAPMSDAETKEILREQEALKLITNTTDLLNRGFHLAANETEVYAQI